MGAGAPIPLEKDQLKGASSPNLPFLLIFHPLLLSPWVSPIRWARTVAIDTTSEVPRSSFPTSPSIRGWGVGGGWCVFSPTQAVHLTSLHMFHDSPCINGMGRAGK